VPCTTVPTSRAEGSLIGFTETTRRLRLGTLDAAREEAVRSILEEVTDLAADVIGRSIVLRYYRMNVWEERKTNELLLDHWPIDPGSVTFTLPEGEELGEWRILEDSLWAEKGWPMPLEVRYAAGWVPPHLIKDWAARTEYAAGDWVRPSSYIGLLQVNEDWTSAAAEVNWTDADVRPEEVAYRRVEELPRSIIAACYEAVIALWRRRDFPRDIVEMQAEGVRIRFDEGRGGDSTGLSKRFYETLERYRAVV